MHASSTLDGVAPEARSRCAKERGQVSIGNEPSSRNGGPTFSFPQRLLRCTRLDVHATIAWNAIRYQACSHSKGSQRSRLARLTPPAFGKHVASTQSVALAVGGRASSHAPKRVPAGGVTRANDYVRSYARQRAGQRDLQPASAMLSDPPHQRATALARRSSSRSRAELPRRRAGKGLQTNDLCRQRWIGSRSAYRGPRARGRKAPPSRAQWPHVANAA